MAEVQEVAKYIIKSLPVDNLKLQKLLYYSQGIHLVLHEKTPLFPESIEAWDYGPVVPEVYRAYKQHGFDVIPPAEDEPLPLGIEEIDAVDKALACFGEMSGVALIHQTHYEQPWRSAYKPGWPSRKISIDVMYDYFMNSLDFSDESEEQS
ncbi:MAG: DUF4065 domain-containing protein [Spirochaetaceae bacterium]|jgi:uncharacterized phage-associated protein|nr:DUF4065 domain-containing protein [Spirochaetaceae bacterium]